MKIGEAPKRKVGRPAKDSDKIPETEIEAIEEGLTTSTEVAEQLNVPKHSVDNKLQRKRNKLKIGFENKPADKNLPSPEVLAHSSTGSQETEDINKEVAGTVPIDATTALKGIWSFVDLMLVAVGKFTKDQIEYTRLSQSELDILAETCNRSEFMRKIATTQGLDPIMIIGVVAGTFGTHIKINMKKKHQEGNPKCECEKCKPTERDVKIISKTVVEQINTPIVVEPKVEIAKEPDKPKPIKNCGCDCHKVGLEGCNACIDKHDGLVIQ